MIQVKQLGLFIGSEGPHRSLILLLKKDGISFWMAFDQVTSCNDGSVITYNLALFNTK